MAEWSKAAASKAVIPVIPGSGVRIPLSPPVIAVEAHVVQLGLVQGNIQETI